MFTFYYSSSFDILVTQAPSFVYEKVEVIFRMDFGKLSEW